MPWISNSTHSFEVLLGEAQSTAACVWTAWFRDTDAGAKTSKPGAPAHGTTSGTAPQTMFSGPAAGLIRDLTSFSCLNLDDVDHRIKVQVNDGISAYSLAFQPVAQLVPVGATLLWDELEGWVIFGGSALKLFTTSLPLSTIYGTIPNISLIIGGDTAGPGEYPSNTAAGTLTNINPLLDPNVGMQQRYYADNY